MIGSSLGSCAPPPPPRFRCVSLQGVSLMICLFTTGRGLAINWAIFVIIKFIYIAGCMRDTPILEGKREIKAR